MTFDWLNHKALMLVKGIGKTATDTLSAENNPVTFNLMSGIVTLDEWIPNIPPIKNSGVWIDSPINDGRQLLAAPVDNVIEKIEITISDSSYNGVQTQLLALNQMIADCRNYWQSEYQIEPVYLLWEANRPNTETPKPQYSLISNIDIAPEYLKADNPTIRISLSVEREPTWSGLIPGANPKLWTFYVNSQQIGTNKTLADATLVTGSDHLLTQTIQNKFEWTPTAFGLQTTPISQNYVAITAAQVPGDAPALLEMSITADVETVVGVYIGKTSKKLSGTGHDGVAHNNALVLNAGDGAENVGSGAAKASVANTIGVRSNGSSVLFYQVARTSTGVETSFANVVVWDGASGTAQIKLDRELFRGSYAVFCRARNNSGAPVLGDMVMRVLVEEFENATNQYLASVALPQVSPQVQNIGLHYMGTITIPFSTRTVQSPLGYGIQLQEANSNLRISLQSKVLAATANRILEVVDLIFMPIDEGLAQINLTIGNSSTNGVVLFDNTGYLNHGERKQSANAYVTNAETGGVSQEVRGSDVFLNPRMDQRLYFLSESTSGGQQVSRLTQTMQIRLNIIPRWYGIRDV